MASERAARVIGLFPELLGIGGVQEASRLTAAALVALAPLRGWELTLLSLNDPAGPHKLGVGGHSIDFRGFGRGKTRFAVSAILAALSLPQAKNTVVVATHPNLAPVTTWMRRTSFRLKTIVMSHGIEVWDQLPGFRRRALCKADAVLGPSSYTVKKLVEVQNVERTRTRRLPWPISPWFLRMVGGELRTSPPKSFPTGPVILTVGRWVTSEQYKGTDDLIRAVSQLTEEFPTVRLVAVGSGDDLPRLQKLAAESGLGDRVTFFENLPREELAACYARADIFALPSAGEGFGLVFLEAMAFSKPIVAAASGGATDVAEDGVNGLVVPPHDPGQLARALKRFLQDPGLRERLGRRGGELVREKYRFEVFQNSLSEIIEPQVAAQHPFIERDGT